MADDTSRPGGRAGPQRDPGEGIPKKQGAEAWLRAARSLPRPADLPTALSPGTRNGSSAVPANGPGAVPTNAVPTNAVPTNAVPVNDGVPANGVVRAPGARTPVDYTLVRRLRLEVAHLMAENLQSMPALDVHAQRELCRRLLREPLADAAHDHVLRGGQPWTRRVEEALGDAVMAALFGMGRLQQLLDDPEVENIELNGCDRVWVCYADGTEVQTGAVADSDEELIEQLQLIATRSGTGERSFTSSTPMLDARLEDGSRLAAMAWTTPRPQVVIRRHRVRDVDLHDLVRMGTLDTVLAAFLAAALRAGLNIIVTGPQNAGKTTLLRALAAEFAPMERFGTIEREFELFLHELPDKHPRVMAMEAREGSSERDAAGRRAGEVTEEELVRRALRFNLRRLIVGEVRGSEVLPMLEAMSVGDGSLCTLHARSATHGIDRLVTLAMAAGIGISDVFAYRLIAGAVNLIVHIDLVDKRWSGGHRSRHVSDVLEINGIGESHRPSVTDVFAPGADGRAVPRHIPTCLEVLVRHGFDARLLDHRGGTWRQPPEVTR
ncbi:MAG: hypothetical protein QG597_4164 [Actinomycetota bacterium]|nr:hypothetical protein [Actinomycetota bacterium]